MISQAHSRVYSQTAAPVKARYATLCELPIPPDMPSEVLSPILIPPPFTIHDFLGTITGVSARHSRLEKEPIESSSYYPATENTVRFYDGCICVLSKWFVIKGWQTTECSKSAQQLGAQNGRSTGTI